MSALFEIFSKMSRPKYFICIHKYEILAPLFPILRMRTCPTMVRSFALRKDEYALVLELFLYAGRCSLFRPTVQ